MDFTDRHEAGRLLAGKLLPYKGKEAVVFALPRGGVVIGKEIADTLKIPLDILLAHKIGHPNQPEYAIAAISEGGQVVENEREVQALDPAWYEAAKKQEMEEIQRRRRLYLKGKKSPSIKGKIAILVDDGIATGLTMQAAILELRERRPKKIVIAVPVAPFETKEKFQTMVDEFIGLEVPPPFGFRGAIGAYYFDFSQVPDSEVIKLLS